MKPSARGTGSRRRRGAAWAGVCLSLLCLSVAPAEGHGPEGKGSGPGKGAKQGSAQTRSKRGGIAGQAEELHEQVTRAGVKLLADALADFADRRTKPSVEDLTRLRTKLEEDLRYFGGPYPQVARDLEQLRTALAGRVGLPARMTDALALVDPAKGSKENRTYPRACLAGLLRSSWIPGNDYEVYEAVSCHSAAMQAMAAGANWPDGVRELWQLADRIGSHLRGLRLKSLDPRLSKMERQRVAQARARLHAAVDGTAGYRAVLKGVWNRLQGISDRKGGAFKPLKGSSPSGGLLAEAKKLAGVADSWKQKVLKARQALASSQRQGFGGAGLLLDQAAKGLETAAGTWGSFAKAKEAGVGMLPSLGKASLDALHAPWLLLGASDMAESDPCVNPGALSVGEMASRGATCPADSPVAKARAALNALDATFPNLLSRLDKAGLKMELDHTAPKECSFTGPSGKAPGHAHGPRHGGALGLFCPDQRLAWADSDYPGAMVAELIHAADQLALENSGDKPTPAEKETLRKKYGDDATTFYGMGKTSVDPKFYELWEKYRGAIKNDCRNELSLGCQGHEQPIELFMELGDHYTAIHGAMGVGQQPPDAKSAGKHRTHLHRDFPELDDYFVETMALATGMEPEALRKHLKSLESERKKQASRQ